MIDVALTVSAAPPRWRVAPSGRRTSQENRAVHEPAAVAQRLAEGAEANDFIRNYIVQALKNPKTGQFGERRRPA